MVKDAASKPMKQPEKKEAVGGPDLGLGGQKGNLKGRVSVDINTHPPEGVVGAKPMSSDELWS